MKYISVICILLLSVFFPRCHPHDPLRTDEEFLKSQISLIQAQIDTLQDISAGLDPEYWRTFYELEMLRHRVTMSEKDSIDDFYLNYVFRFRRPVTAVLEPDRTSPFIFPVSVHSQQATWEIPVIWGRLFYFDYNHLGTDIYGSEGDTVRAIYDGTIKHYESAGGYGDLVVVIEHQYRDSWKKSSIPPVFISIYGHLRKERIRNGGQALPWKEEDIVRKGDILGYINDDDNNGDGAEHLHFGIRLQSANEAKRNDSGRWLRGYDNRQGSKLRHFMDPINLYGRYIQFIFRD